MQILADWVIADNVAYMKMEARHESNIASVRDCAPRLAESMATQDTDIGIAAPFDIFCR